MLSVSQKDRDEIVTDLFQDLGGRECINYKLIRSIPSYGECKYLLSNHGGAPTTPLSIKYTARLGWTHVFNGHEAQTPDKNLTNDEVR